jgi:hypothetical protein
MGFLIRLCHRLVRRQGRVVGDEVYDAALDLARRRGSLRDANASGGLPGEWL